MAVCSLGHCFFSDPHQQQLMPSARGRKASASSHPQALALPRVCWVLTHMAQLELAQGPLLGAALLQELHPDLPVADW